MASVFLGPTEFPAWFRNDAVNLQCSTVTFSSSPFAKFKCSVGISTRQKLIQPEILSSTHFQRTQILLQWHKLSTMLSSSPETIPFFLLSNDDHHERAAAVRREVMALPSTASSASSDNGVTRGQVKKLFHNCIKLASENKINQKNAWKLKLIDHLSEIIKEEIEADSAIIFQKASLTLEAGVKIYSSRVDSVHSQAYKLLGQIFQSGEQDQQGNLEAIGSFCGEGENHSKEDKEEEISPFSTLEQSFETLNMKKFDEISLEADYHQTSIPFSEGLARRLLLYNLGVYGNCKVLFDSLEDPRICISGCKQTSNSDNIDLSSAREDIEHMIINMREKHEITPTLSKILSQTHRVDFCGLNQFTESPKSAGRADAVYDNDIQPDSNWSSYTGEASCSCGSGSNGIQEHLTFKDSSSPSYCEANNSYMVCQPAVDGKYDEFIACLLQVLEFPSKQNTWKGIDHWKYQNPKGSKEIPATKRRSGFKVKKSKKNELLDNDISFSSFLGKDLSNIFASPKNQKSLLLPISRGSFSNKLPEYQYQPEDLLKLFLCQNIKFIEKRKPDQAENNSRWQSTCLDEETPVLDDENAYGGSHSDLYVEDHFEESYQFVSPSCQILESEVQHDKVPKQADVLILKQILWDCIQESGQMPQLVGDGQISFKDVVARFPATTLGDIISPHLCFICLLHLASDNSLRIKGNSNLDDLTIYLPPCRSMS